VKDLEGRYLLVNHRFEQVFGILRAKLVGLKDADIFPPEEARAFRAMDLQVLEGGRPWVGEEVASGEDGPHAYLSIKSPLLDGEGRPFAICGISTDITDRKRAETDLRKTRFALERSQDPMFHLDPQGRILEVNESACRRLERARGDLVGQTIQSIEPYLVTVWPERWGQIKASGSLRVEGSHRAPSGRSMPLEVSYHFYEFQGEEGCLAFFRDLSETRALEEQLRQSQKMDAIGQLAGGIAHDFNNILSAIGLYTTLALEDLPPDTPARHSIEGIQLAGQKAAALTRQLLSFSRKQAHQPEAVNLGQILTGLEPMLRRLMGETIQLQAQVAPDLGLVMADPSLVEQALLNLVVNARDSMPSGGSIRMEAREVHLAEDDVERPFGVPPGPYVLLVVTDSGCGMDPEVQSHIFEPFFTTKERGKGTGLGLATVYGIVQQAKGHIWVESEVGRGTTFTLCFPRAAADQVQHRPEAEPTFELGRGEHVLLVEDEESLRELVAGILSLRGYQVNVAVDGVDALQAFAGGQRPLDLLVTDVIMPRMNGKELSEALLKVYPGLKVIFMSGYTAENSVHRGLLQANVPFLQKPFAPHALLRKAREVLG
jgi:PAS domain S-box-containing protein